MPTLKQNISFLSSLMKSAPSKNRGKIQNIIDFYKDRKINQYRTAENAVLLLSSSNKKISQKADKIYDSLFDKSYSAIPITGKLKREREANADYFLNILLYTDKTKR
jgi:hypothetical protein